MAIVACRECGEKVSSEAKTCPHCGISKPQPKRTSLLTWIIAALIAAGFLGAFSSVGNNRRDTDAAAPAISPEKAAEIERARKAREEAYQRQRLTVVNMVLAVRSSARNPGSVQWESMGMREDGTVVCGQFRAQNGFGGVNKESASMVNGKLSLASAPWNKHCLKDLIDVTSIARDVQ